tara:strand:+ start:110 stop:967 length:858 start_codon:yes stop_codon:yes gene_type:complete
MSKPYLTARRLSANRWLVVAMVPLLALGLVMSNMAVARVIAEPVDVSQRLPHDASAFTQGFLIDDAGHWYESTGLYGHSAIRRNTPRTGRAITRRELKPRYFGEGLARIDDRLYQLTWKSGRGFVYDRDTLQRIADFSYTGQGWGLARCGNALVMSDGSDTLTFRDPTTFEITDRLPVRRGERAVGELNELEVIHGMIWANQWHTNRLLIIDPGSGEVVAVRDATRLAAEQPDSADVFNGIAYDRATDSVYVTGKQWTYVYALDAGASRIGVEARTSQRCLMPAE